MRVGTIDIGSNSVRFVVFDGANRSPSYFFNEKVMCSLGEGVRETGYLSKEGRKRALRALKRFSVLGQEMGVSPLSCVATAAVRDAQDGKAFAKEVEAETGLRIEIISGEQEAAFSARGVLLGWPDATGLVCDIGGSSMEIARISEGAIERCATSSLGPLTLLDVGKSEKERKSHIEKELKELRKAVGKNCETLYLVGGAWRAIAQIDMTKRDYVLKVLQGYESKTDRFRETAKWVSLATPEELRAVSDSSSQRLKLLPIAAEVLEMSLGALKPETVRISSYGLREGLLYERMPVSHRSRDPLIEAARFSEKHEARTSGFGEMLFSWVRPLFLDWSAQNLRLARAACLLHDVAWRAHPDYRAGVAFDQATRANLGGIDHKQRVFLGLALLHRYASGAKARDKFAAISLLDENEITASESLGKAMRLGAMIDGGTKGALNSCSLSKDKENLILRIGKDVQDFNGEVVEKRLQSLSKTLGLMPVITIG